ncbi:MAG: tetratricopeptide repeat protein [Burkholderiales bacterium]
MRPGEGLVILSVSMTGISFQSSVIEFHYQRVGSGDTADYVRLPPELFALAPKGEFSDGRYGRVAGLVLPAGRYEFTRFAGRWSSTFFQPDFRLSKQFEAAAGAVVYAGNFNLHIMREPEREKHSVSPEWNDEAASDFAAISGRAPWLRRESVRVDIKFDERDKARLQRVRSLYAAAERDADAKFELGVALVRGHRTTLPFHLRADLPAGLKLLTGAAEQGHGDAAYQLGAAHEGDVALFAGLVQRDHAQALAFYRQAGEAGSFLAMSRLARIYQAGDLGAQADPAQAAQWLQRARDLVGRSDDARRRYEAMARVCKAFGSGGETYRRKHGLCDI